MLFTIGHGAATQEDLAARLRAAELDLVMDIRIAPGSRRHPHVARDALAEWLPAMGIGYRWEKRLGGFRKPPPDSPDVALRNESFRAYAAHMRTPEFIDAIDCAFAFVVGQRVALMCSETVWWRCHRRMVSDFAELARGIEVRHVMPGAHGGDRLDPHKVTDGVRLAADGLLVYDAGVQPLPSSAG
jgi:uncharacterized protein (DUF488 family)